MFSKAPVVGSGCEWQFLVAFLQCVFSNAPATEKKKKVVGSGCEWQFPRGGVAAHTQQQQQQLATTQVAQKATTLLLTNGGRVISWLLLPSIRQLISIYFCSQQLEGSLGAREALKDLKL